jgi:hypothetical protein
MLGERGEIARIRRTMPAAFCAEIGLSCWSNAVLIHNWDGKTGFAERSVMISCSQEATGEERVYSAPTAWNGLVAAPALAIMSHPEDTSPPLE